MKQLGINIDHVATLRQARGTRYPDPVAAAAIVEGAGADQIVVHLREDRRHIQEQDLRTLRKTIRTALNLELACTDTIVAIAAEIRPDCCTFVPERRNELTTEGGLDVRRSARALQRAIAKLRGQSITVSLFIDPEIRDVEAAKSLEVDTIELHTGAYCEAQGPETAQQEIERLQRAAERAGALGLRVAAGHGLNYENLRAVVTQVPTIVEYNIGHSVISRAVFAGLSGAVQEMRALLAFAPGPRI